MSLSVQQIHWIGEVLKECKITYKEVYAEIYDHILSAIEAKQQAGDSRDIPILFQEVINEDFNGFDGIKKIATDRAKVLKGVIWNNLWLDIKNNRLQTLIVGFVILVISVILPSTKMVKLIFSCSSFALAIIPLLYLVCVMGIKNIFSNKSLKLGTLCFTATYAIVIFNFLYNSVFGSIKLFYFLRDDEWRPIDCPTLILAILLVILLAFNVSFVRLCQKEFKKGLVLWS